MPNINNPKEIAEKGEAVYAEKYQTEYERTHKGEFVAIDVLGGSATLGKTASEALLMATKLFPTGMFHVIRVGHRGAFEVGLSYKNVSPDRLHR